MDSTTLHIADKKNIKKQSTQALCISLLGLIKLEMAFRCGMESPQHIFLPLIPAFPCEVILEGKLYKVGFARVKHAPSVITENIFQCRKIVLTHGSGGSKL